MRFPQALICDFFFFFFAHELDSFALGTFCQFFDGTKKKRKKKERMCVCVCVERECLGGMGVGTDSSQGL